MKQDLYQQLAERKRSGRKSFTVLIDPDKVDGGNIDQLVTLAVEAKVDYFFVGGSLVISSHLDECPATARGFWLLSPKQPRFRPP